MKLPNIKQLGPGLIFAGAAIGVSHLVQSTRAGADFGLGLIWALLLVNACKYPFFQFGPRYSLATGESLLDGYLKMGKGLLWVYIIITAATMFTIQTAVTIVTAGIANALFGDFISTEAWTLIILATCFGILIKGRYAFLDKLMKIIVIILTLSTLAAVTIALNNTNQPLSWTQKIPKNSLEVGFLIAFMGWMPAPLDISIWHSLWALEKNKTNKEYSVKHSLFDFNVGYVATIVIGCCFILLGTLVMFHSGESFSGSAGGFANQLISMYTENLGNWAYIVIGIAAFTTMFSTTLTTLDASPRSMAKAFGLLFKKESKSGHLLWMIFLTLGTLAIFFFLKSEMVWLITVATILSFLTAPFYAIINYLLISGRHTPKEWQPSLKMHILSWMGIVFLVGFSMWYLTTF